MKHKRGVTLLEVMIVVMILSMLTAVGAPKLATATSLATDNSLSHTLCVIRDAIDRYALDHRNQWPGQDGAEATFKSDLGPYLRGRFPKCPVGARNNQIKISTSPGQSTLAGEVNPVQGWHYHNRTGIFIANSKAICTDHVTPYDEF